MTAIIGIKLENRASEALKLQEILSMLPPSMQRITSPKAILLSLLVPAKWNIQ